MVTTNIRSSHANHFPSRLHAILDDAEAKGHHNILSWNVDGKSFTIHQSGLVLVPIIGLYFRQTKYKSFLRQLQGYEFTRITRGAHKGRCSHPEFQRGLRSKSKQMKRKPTAVVNRLVTAAAIIVTASVARTGTETREASTTGIATPPTTTLAQNVETRKRNSQRSKEE